MSSQDKAVICECCGNPYTVHGYKWFEWIPYNQFNDIKEIDKDDTATLYSATWMNGQLKYENYKVEKKRVPNEKVALKCMYNSQNITNEFLSEVKSFSIYRFDYDILKIYGISQNPETRDYIIVFQERYCETCGKICKDLRRCWCKPYGPLKYLDVKINEWKYERLPNKRVALRCVYNSQKFIDEAKGYSIDDHEYDIPHIYGITQNANTKDYIIVLDDRYCKNCGKIGEIYTNEKIQWCKPSIWIDGPLYFGMCSCIRVMPNKKVVLKCLSYNSQNITDEFLSEARLCFDNNTNNDLFKYGISQNPNTNDYIIVFGDDYCEICGKFDNIKEVGKGGFAMVYSAIWKDGPFIYHYGKSVNENYKRSPNRVVALKNLYNSQNISNEFLNEIKKYSIKFNDNILKIYGISQNPDTKDYIMVFEYANGGNFINYINNYAVNWSWHERLEALENVINGLKIIHENDMVHRDFHTGNILSFINVQGGDENLDSSFYISDMGLCGDVSNVDETKLYGVMPFMSPEVLRGNPYTKAADIYSFDPNNRPSAIKIEELINSFMYPENKEIIVQFKEAEEYRKANFLSIKNNQLTTHSQAYYTSRLLNQFTRVLTECLDCLDCSIDD
ncbi:uncharacterized protein OCT59_025321 [Rhizophagus irregularis]|uniref:uncharacterized protein n=1 Tax=Rhizophagus irregularis TaxID=588596 RepID=UPI0033346011|nr:hypothetical protein OCT59_025321 [Rhizophagus irregularis]